MTHSCQRFGVGGVHNRIFEEPLRRRRSATSAHQPEKERDDENGYEDIEQDLGDARRSPCNATKTKDRRDDGDHQEY
jgi:hypothetical protein